MEVVTIPKVEHVRLLKVEEAARSLHAGLASAQDPMDVDDRIERLGVVLAVGVETEEGGNEPCNEPR